MTPAERIAESFTDEVIQNWWDGNSPRRQRFPDPDWLGDHAINALCPNGQRIVLDRTGDTDRLADLGEVLTKIRAAMHKSAAYAEGNDDDYSVAGAVAHGEASALRWVLDLFEDGTEGAPA